MKRKLEFDGEIKTKVVIVKEINYYIVKTGEIENVNGKIIWCNVVSAEMPATLKEALNKQSDDNADRRDNLYMSLDI